jgi:thymidylate kinase
VSPYNKSIVISFMGVDGSGKSTLIDLITKKFKNKYKNIKYIHLRPYLFLTDKSVTNANPHQKKSRSKFISLLQILTWLIIYQIFFFFKLRKKNQLIIFDRYAHDLQIDKIRYRFSLSDKLTKSILSLFPEPHLWIVLKAPIKLIEKRKKELPIKELKRQMKLYVNFSYNRKNTLLLNTSKNITNSISSIEKKLIIISTNN